MSKHQTFLQILAILGLIFFVVNYTERHSNKLLLNKEEVNATDHLNMKEPVEVEDGTSLKKFN